MAKKILIVDDEQDILELVADLLSGANYDVIRATNGAEALSKIAHEKPDLVLLDIRMPGLDGIEVCKRVKADPLLSKIPILLITASSTKVTSEIFEATKAEGYILKPFEVGFVLQKVKEFL